MGVRVESAQESQEVATVLVEIQGEGLICLK